MNKFSPMLIALLVFTAWIIHWWPSFGATANSFPGGFSVSSLASQLTGGEALPESFSRVSASKPLPALPMPLHPHQDNRGMSGAHADSYNSGVVPFSGPTSSQRTSHSRMVSALFSGCSTQHFDPQGRLISVCVGLHKSTLILLDPNDLSVLATTDLPPMSGWYFRLDKKGRVWVPAGHAMELHRYHIEENADGPAWVIDKQLNVGSAIPENERVFKSFPMDLVFDWQGNLWFTVFEPALMGYVEAGTDKVYAQRLQGEVIENGLGASKKGVFFVTDHNFYYLNAEQGIREIGRFSYDNNNSTESLSQGSGSTPVVFANGQLTAFSDNAEPKPNVLVYRLDDVPDTKRLVCKIPMFEDDMSALENSFIAYDHSIIVENNFNFSVFGDSAGGQPGLARIDVKPDFSGCNIVWENNLVASGSGAKLSTGNGLIYQYALEENTGWVNAWYFTAVDFFTGELVWKQYAGSGKQWDNAMLTVTIGPAGQLIVGTYTGLISVVDPQ